tara:strand:- start:2140 stop:2280 length:141 start_codon:yes stop_codon:yes gene_type:complete
MAKRTPKKKEKPDQDTVSRPDAKEFAKTVAKIRADLLAKAKLDNNA